MALHGVQLIQQIASEIFGFGIAAKGTDSGDAGIVFRQGLGLLIALHLQAVFDLAQEFIRSFEVVRHRRLDL